MRGQPFQLEIEFSEMDTAKRDSGQTDRRKPGG